jgi:hypothetical protein
VPCAGGVSLAWAILNFSRRLRLLRGEVGLDTGGWDCLVALTSIGLSSVVHFTCLTLLDKGGTKVHGPRVRA